MPLLRLRDALVAFAFALALPGAAWAEDQPAPTVDSLIQSMTSTLAAATSITVHVEKMFDDVLVTGEKLQYSGAIDIALRRPDRFAVSYGDDLSAKEAWYDGAKLVLFDPRVDVYGELPAKNTIDATLAAVAKEYDLRMPLAGLLSSNAYQAYTERALEARYIGLHDVNGVAAHHILLADENVQWQLWIDAGATPLPLKLVVTALDEPGEPQSIFMFSDWNLAADLPDDVFKPDIPDGAVLAAFLPRKGE